MNEVREKRIVELLEEISKWQRFQGFVKLKEVLSNSITTDKEKQIYELSTGEGTQEIADKLGVSHGTVYNYWQKWSKLGVLEPSKKYKGRYERMISLDDIGIEVPNIKKEVMSENSDQKSAKGGENGQ